jgi:DNA-binding SARP family transcriptional activator
VPVAGSDLGSRKARLLLKLLAAERAHLVGVDRVIDVLWDHEPPVQAAENVSTLVSRLRRELGAGIIEGGRDGYRLGSPPAVTRPVRRTRGTARSAVRFPGRVLHTG